MVNNELGEFLNETCKKMAKCRIVIKMADRQGNFKRLLEYDKKWSALRKNLIKKITGDINFYEYVAIHINGKYYDGKLIEIDIDENRCAIGFAVKEDGRIGRWIVYKAGDDFEIERLAKTN